MKKIPKKIQIGANIGVRNWETEINSIMLSSVRILKNIKL